MQDAKEIEQELIAHDVRPTPVRLLVLRAMKESPYALSLSELEGRLGTVDKSSISRTLNLFLDRHLVHSIDDGAGVVKYATCAEIPRASATCISTSPVSAVTAPIVCAAFRCLPSRCPTTSMCIRPSTC